MQTRFELKQKSDGAIHAHYTVDSAHNHFPKHMLYSGVPVNLLNAGISVFLHLRMLEGNTDSKKGALRCEIEISIISEYT